ncbi:MAG: YjbH domain-containing protein [Pseudomonadota bacterium]
MIRQRGQGGWSPATAILAMAALLFVPSTGTDARAESPVPPQRPSQNLFGITGLIDTPTAEMQPVGQISATASYFGGFNRNTVSMQILPFLEVGARYSILSDFFPAGQDRTLYDRSFDLKLRLVEEAPLWPALAVGLQDVLGTGSYSGEYVVASKSFFDGDLTVSGGVGWGRLATLNGLTNPIGEIAEEARDRNTQRSGGGDVNLGAWFRGEEMGYFGGLAWRAPLDGLTLKLEYSNDAYESEDDFSDFRQEIPINLGAEYRPVEWAEIGAYWMYGQEFGVRLSLSASLYEPLISEERVPPPLPFTPRPVPEAARAEAEAALGPVFDAMGAGPTTRAFVDLPLAEVALENSFAGVRWARATLSPAADDTCPVDLATAVDAELGVIDAITIETTSGQVLCTLALRPKGEAAIRLTRRAMVEHPTDWTTDPNIAKALRRSVSVDLEAMGLGLASLELAPASARLHVTNSTFAETPRAIGRTARAAARHLPASIETIEIVPIESGLPVVSVSVARSALEESVNRPDAAQDLWSTVAIADAPSLSDAARAQVQSTYPELSWGVAPQIPISVFDGDEPARADLQIAVFAGIAVTPEFSLSGTLSKRVVGNLDEIDQPTDSALPRVRADFAEYLREGDPGITRLTGDYVTKLAPDLYGRLSAGLFERMFGGVQGELLWKPADQSWGLGAELAYARQRDFDTLFDFQDYDVVTGHVSLYWDTPFHDLAVQLDAGRYLAGDYGGTVSLKRRFSNGWEIGAFTTFTDASFDEFGEGSFDKGLYLTIPLNWTLPQESRSEIASVVRPLNRDGGQRLQIANRLYPVVEDLDRHDLHRRSGGFWE